LPTYKPSSEELWDWRDISVKQLGILKCRKKFKTEIKNCKTNGG
jgi:hypothetical protein